MSVSGLALASSISSTIYGLTLYIPLRRKYKNEDVNRFALSILKMIFCAAVMVCAVIPVRNLLWDANGSMLMKIISVGASVMVGIIVYILTCKLTKLYEAETAFNFVKKALKKKS